jgi:hypothetical protein
MLGGRRHNLYNKTFIGYLDERERRRESEMKFRSVDQFEFAFNVIILADSCGNIIFWNTRLKLFLAMGKMKC